MTRKNKTQTTATAQQITEPAANATTTKTKKKKPSKAAKATAKPDTPATFDELIGHDLRELRKKQNYLEIIPKRVLDSDHKTQLTMFFLKKDSINKLDYGESNLFEMCKTCVDYGFIPIITKSTLKKFQELEKATAKKSF